MTAAPAFSITESLTGQIRVLRLQGALDGSSCVELKERIGALLKTGAKHVVLELSGLRYVASAGIAVFINVQNRLRAQGGSLQLAAPTPAVREVFEVLNLSSIITICDRVEQAASA